MLGSGDSPQSLASRIKSRLDPVDLSNLTIRGFGDSPPVLSKIPYLNHLFSNATDDRHFFDLAAYCPGMAASLADIQAVLEAEAPPGPQSLAGTIDPAARKLFDNARFAGWQSLTVPGAKPQAGAVTITFDGAGRYTYERILPPGITERVICDGKTLLHLYPDLGIGARRAVSRFHRIDFARSVPWVLPPVEDLVREADLKIVDERTVALVPHGVEAVKDAEGKPLPYAVIHFVFGADGKLSEKQVVEMPAKKVILRETASAWGKVSDAKCAGVDAGCQEPRCAAAALSQSRACPQDAQD